MFVRYFFELNSFGTGLSNGITGFNLDLLLLFLELLLEEETLVILPLVIVLVVSKTNTIPYFLSPICGEVILL